MTEPFPALVVYVFVWKIVYDAESSCGKHREIDVKKQLTKKVDNAIFILLRP